MQVVLEKGATVQDVRTERAQHRFIHGLVGQFFDLKGEQALVHAPWLEGYGIDAVDRESLDALLPLLMLRRLIDVQAEGPDEDRRRLTARLTSDTRISTTSSAFCAYATRRNRFSSCPIS